MSGSTASVALGPMPATIRSPRAVNFVSDSPQTTSTGMSRRCNFAHRGSWEPVPASRRLEANPGPVFLRRSSKVGGGRVDVGEHRVLHPQAEEFVEGHGGVAGMNRIESVGEGGVRCPSHAPPFGVVDARGARDQDQRPHQLGEGQGQMEAESGAHRIPQVGGGPTCLAQQDGSIHQGGRHLRRVAMARHVHGNHLMVTGQVAVERPPHPTRLGEPVGQHQARPLAARLVVQRGGGTGRGGRRQRGRHRSQR